MTSSNLKYIGTLTEGQPTVLFITGGMGTTPAVFDGIENKISWQSAQIDWSLSEGPWDVVEIGNRVALFIEEHKLGPTVLAGYSAGGVISLQAALKNSDKVVGMLLSNTGPCAIGHGDPDLPKKILLHWGEEAFMETFLLRCFSRPIEPSLKKKMISYTSKVSAQAAYESSLTLRQHDLRPYLNEIKCPVVIAHGKLDKARTMDHIKMLQDGLPNTELFLLDGGHTIMIEDHDNWVKILNYLLLKVSN